MHTLRRDFCQYKLCNLILLIFFFLLSWPFCGCGVLQISVYSAISKFLFINTQVCRRCKCISCEWFWKSSPGAHYTDLLIWLVGRMTNTFCSLVVQKFLSANERFYHRKISFSLCCNISCFRIKWRSILTCVHSVCSLILHIHIYWST